MARINIEECWWSDPRRMKLIELVGTFAADGIAINAWRLAQGFWAKGELVPLSIWKHLQANDKLIEANLAEVREDGVYVRGSSQYLDWVKERRRAASAGGKRSAQKRPKRKQSTQANAEQTQANGKQTQASGSSSSSSSSSSSLGLIEPKNGSPPETSGSQLNRQIWDSYSAAYFERYHQEPVRNAKVNSQINQLGQRLGEEAPHVVAFYVAHNKTHYASRVHELGLCLADAEGLRTQWAKGKAITNADIKRFERAVESNSLDQMIEEGKI